MKRILKIFLAILFIVLLLFIALGIWITYFLDLNQYKSQISRLIRHQSGYEVNLNGDISWSLYPSLGLTLAEVEILDKDNPGNILIDLKALHLSLDIRALKHHEIKVTDVLIKGLDLRVIYGGAKSTESIVVQKTNQSVTAQQDKQQAEIETVSPAVAKENEKKLMAQLAHAEIERVLIENSNIFLIDKTTGKTYSLSSVRLETAHIKLGAPIDFSLSTRFIMPNKKGMDVNLSARLVMEQGLLSMQLDPFKLIIDQDIFDGHFRLDRHMSPWTFQMALSSHEFDWSKFVKDSKQTINMKDINATVNLSFDLEKVDIAKSLEGDIQLSSGELSFNGVSLTDKAKQLLELRQMFVNNQASLGDLVSKAKSIAQNAYTPSKSTMMNKFKMKSHLKDKIMSSDVEITGDQYLVFGNGTLGFDQSLNFKLFLGLPEQQDKNLPTLVIPLKIKGIVAEPEVSLDEKEMLKQVDVIMRARVTDEVQQKIKDQASGFLKKFGR